MENVYILCFSTFQCPASSVAESSNRRGFGDSGGSRLAITSVVSSSATTAGVPSCSSELHTDPSISSQPSPSHPPSCQAQSTQPSGLQDLRLTFHQQGLSSAASSLLLNSWRPATARVYNVYIQKWCLFCKERTLDQCEVSVINVVNFLAFLFYEGASYRTINLARSAVSAFLSPSGLESVGSHPLVVRLIRGVFQSRPALPKYQTTWNVDIVINFLADWPSLESSSLTELTLRTVMLLALLTGQRGQTLHQLKVTDISFTIPDCCEIAVSAVLKTSSPRAHLKPMFFKSFENKKLCIVSHLKEYLVRTSKLRSDEGLFVGCIKPHKHVSRETVARWIKSILKGAGIDINTFSAHSTRAASTSAAAQREVPLDTIMSAAGWSNTTTFARFYQKEVVQDSSLALAVIQKNK